MTSSGRHIRFFNVIDEYTRTALTIIWRRFFEAADVVVVLEYIIGVTGAAPTHIRCGNGPEFSVAALIDWWKTAGVDTIFIDPSSPRQDGFTENLSSPNRSPEKS